MPRFSAPTKTTANTFQYLHLYLIFLSSDVPSFVVDGGGFFRNFILLEAFILFVVVLCPSAPHFVCDNLEFN